MQQRFKITIFAIIRNFFVEKIDAEHQEGVVRDLNVSPDHLKSDDQRIEAEEEPAFAFQHAVRQEEDERDQGDGQKFGIMSK